MTYHCVNTKGIVQLLKIENMCFGVYVRDTFEMFTFFNVTFHKLVFKRSKTTTTFYDRKCLFDVH